MKLLNTVLDIASNKLPNAGVDCILVGGFAVNHYGYTRSTLDIDFMIFAEELEAVRTIMIHAGFTNIVIENIVAFFETPNSALRVDFLRVDKNTIQKINKNSVTANVHGYELRVPSLKDLISMKIFALSQNLALRMAKDLPDITYLCIIHDLDLITDIQPLCKKFGTDNIFDLICTQIQELKRR